MKIGIIGMSYRTAPVEIREKYSFDKNTIQNLTEVLLTRQNIQECVVISTCNRMEVYYVYEDEGNSVFETLKQCICDVVEFDGYNYENLFYHYKGLKAVEHLFVVAAGLDSLVMGEDQILGQIRNAFSNAKEIGSSDVVFNTLFRFAVTAAKRIKTETSLSKTPSSISSIAVRHANDMMSGGLHNKTALVIGSGKMGRIAMKYLLNYGIRQMYVTMRTDKEDELRSEFQGNWEKIACIEYQKRYEYMEAADLIISSTAGPQYTVTMEEIQNINLGEAKLFFDLAVPRDIDPRIKNIPDVTYVHLDMLEAIANQGDERKEQEKEKALAIVDQFIQEFKQWYNFRMHLPVVKSYQKLAEDIVEEKTKKILSKLTTISVDEQEYVRANISSAVNGIMDKFLYHVRECSDKDVLDTYFTCLRTVMNNKDK